MSETEKYIKAAKYWRKNLTNCKGWSQRVVAETKRPSPIKALVEMGFIVMRNKV